MSRRHDGIFVRGGAMRKGIRTAITAALVLICAANAAHGQDQDELFLFGHDDVANLIATIDPTNGGSGSAVTPIGHGTGFASTASGLATARGPVKGPDGKIYPAGTIFGVLKENFKEFIVVIETMTGEAFKVVEIQNLLLGGRGVAFGPDGTSLFVKRDTGELYLISTTTGLSTPAGNTGFAGSSLTYDPGTESFLSISGNHLISINPSTAAATIISSLANPPAGFNACTLEKAPDGSLYTIDSTSGDLFTVADGFLTQVLNVVSEGGLSTSICGTAIAPQRELTFKISINIDIKPGASPNSINIDKVRLVPVAILSATDFDATTCDPNSITLAGAEVRLIGKGSKYQCSHEDVNSDELVDLVCQLETADWLVEVGDTTAKILATCDGVEVIGEDSIRIVPPEL